MGSFLGGGVAVWVAFRSEHRRARRVNAGAVVVGGPVVFFPLWRYLEPLEWDWLSPQVVLAVALILVGLAGRWLALRTRAPD